MKPQRSFLLLLTLLTVASPRKNAKESSSSSSSPSNGALTEAERAPRGDDLTLQDLNSVLQQQASTLQMLQSQLQAERYQVQTLQGTVDSLSQVVDQLRNDNHVLSARLNASARAVGFSARFSTDGGQMAGVSLGYHSTLVFDNVLANTGNAYDPNTGIFTSPVSGLYSLFLTQMTADSQERLWLSIVREGQVVDRIFTEGGHTDSHDQGASQVVTHLQAGQRVWVRQEEGTAVRGSYFTVFTGYLIQAD